MIILVLMFGVIFVNGWTDAPNAIATVISTRVMRPRSAVIMAILLNFVGALVMTLINAKVAATISNMVSFEAQDTNLALIALAAAMFAIVVWAVVAWFFGIPTSESHALIAGITGGAVALNGWGAINPAEWNKVLIGLCISSVLGFVMGYLTTKLIEVLFRRVRRSVANRFFAAGQTFGAGAMAFLHGAQDGQKFMGTFLLGVFLFNSEMVSMAPDGTFIIPIWLILACSVIMGLGTSAGGYRIIKAVGMDMVKLEKYQGFSADISASFCLLISSISGIPVSTTHTKTTAIMGVGASKRVSAVNWKIVKDMVVAWVLTFPGCGLIAFIMAKIFLSIF